MPRSATRCTTSRRCRAPRRDAGGTITFNLYGPSDTPDCSGTPVLHQHGQRERQRQLQLGRLHAVDGRASTTGSPPTPVTRTTCPRPGRVATRARRRRSASSPPAISTAATSGTLGDAVHDIATLSGATANAGGTITFSLYGPSDTPDCSGDAGVHQHGQRERAGQLQLGQLHADRGRQVLLGRLLLRRREQPALHRACGDEGETSTLVKRPTAIVTAATSGTIGDAVHDVATLSGASADAGGTITFNLYGPSDTPDCCRRRRLHRPRST